MAKKKTLWMTLSVVGNMGLAIAVPIVIFSLLGRFLDNKYQTSPWFLLTGMIVALVVTSIILGSKIMKLLKEVEAENKPVKPSEDKNQ